MEDDNRGVLAVLALLRRTGVAVNRHAVGGEPLRIWRARPSRRTGHAENLRHMNLDLEAHETSFDLVADAVFDSVSQQLDIAA